MSQRTRYFLIGSSLILVIGLGTGLVAYYGGNLPIGRSAAGPSELAYLPAGSAAVAYADVHAIMNSEFRQRLRQIIPSGEAKDALLAETGIDIERDVDTVVAGFAGSTTGQDAEATAVVLVRGRFNTPQIETLATNHGGTVDTYREIRMITFSHAGSAPAGQAGEGLTTAKQPGNGGVAFLEPGLLALGTVDALKHAVDASADHRDVTGNAELMKLLTETEGSGNAWVVGQFDALSQSAQLPSQVRDHLPAVQWFSVSVNVNNGVSGVVRADARDEQSGEQLRDAVRGGLAMVRLVSGKDQRVDAIVNSVQLSGTGKTVALGFTLPPDVLDIINGIGAAGKLGVHTPNQPDRLEKQLKRLEK